ncbi:centromere protein I-like [Lingula anatina]|uniref:Centromere protein I-like n=1 Tax=Lingula anatina TaxID=7574 RepID=A0A1S3ILG5_LINAN|nr:centromere protein I-like [Lingula anatina]|eukprot:XP_013398928.1 centromere protein I-like [Lingula anatina]
MGSSLRSKLLLYYMSCTSNPVTAARFSYWLSSVLSEEILHSPYSKRGEEILEALANFTDFLQESVPVCETFLTKYLHLWDGTSYRIYILVLITRFRLYPFSTLNDLLLEPLRKLFFCSNVYFKCQLLICLRKLLQNFITVELERYNTTLRRQENVLENTTETFNHVSLFVEEVEKFQPLQTVAEFIDFVDAMCLVGLGLEKDNALMMSCVLDFFELVSSLTVQYGTPFVLLPSRGLIYKGLFANNGMTCSRMCGILLNCRNGFLKLKSMPKPDNLGLVNIDVNSIDTLNACVLDFCDSLWRYRAFKKDTRYPTAFTVEDGVVEALSVPRVNECFSLHRHQAFLGFAWAYLKEFQPPEKKVHPDQIKQAKRSYLEFLRREQLHGIAEFIEQFIKKASSSMSKSHIAASMASP